MKTFTYLLFGMFGLAATTMSENAQAQPGVSFDISFNSFYNQLSPYGRWLNVPQYGQVWSYNEPGFRPYATNGQWQDTDEGWYWNSSYPWGSIPFHYGRWELDPYYGWIWIPGYDYAPAWVAWSQADDCYGWAPLGFGLDVNVSFGRIPANRWMYASAGNIYRSHIDRYCVPYQRSNFYYGRQRPIVNVYTQRNARYFSGPRRDNDNRFNDRYPAQRPPVREGQYGNRGEYNRGDDRRPREDRFQRQAPERPIHLDPNNLDRQRAIADNRPSPSEMRTGREQPGSPINRQRPDNNRFNAEPARPEMTQPRVLNEPAARPQRNSDSRGSRPSAGMTRDRRIF